MKQSGRIARKQALGMSEVIPMYLRSMGLTSAMNTRRIYAAWDQASGAAAYTTQRFFRAGILYITLSSSVVRSSLSFRREELIRSINSLLSTDVLFTRGDDSSFYVKELRLK